MAGYSEVINVIGAMIIFSMILLNANHMIHRNTLMQIEGELEQEVIALGQEIIEEALSKSFDQVTTAVENPNGLPPSIIPEGFTPAEQLGPDMGENSRSDFNDFDDYHGWEGTVETEHGSFHLSAEVFYVNEVVNGNEVSFEPIISQSTFKKIEVTVISQYLTNNKGEPVNYKLNFVRNYYAD